MIDVGVLSSASVDGQPRRETGVHDIAPRNQHHIQGPGCGLEAFRARWHDKRQLIVDSFITMNWKCDLRTGVHVTIKRPF